MCECVQLAEYHKLMRARFMLSSALWLHLERNFGNANTFKFTFVTIFWNRPQTSKSRGKKVIMRELGIL
jgi:hypothetical protein